jgi:hypothetical protein
MIRFLPIAALALIGCFGSDYTTHLDTGFAPSVLAATKAAAADWEANVPVKITVADGACPPGAHANGLICMHPVALLPSLPWEPGITLGFTILTDMWIAETLAEKMSPALLQRLIAHEMGHAMGLEHTGPGTLMDPYSDEGALTVQPADAQQWLNIRIAEGKLAPDAQ